PKPNPESNTAIRLYATVSKSFSNDGKESFQGWKVFGKPISCRAHTPAERTQKKGQKPLRSLPHTYLS
ncbi:hypothetical protein, partial [uncultured Porphyromonas sp.]|uniref:hypothetical protein n=1 Tax=uncultured Porphyromonas sp. TaxID=159274 RepID=UPI0026362FD0